MKVRVIAADSMGVRSFATVVEVEGYKLFIDPGASLAPRRYGLPPHPLEVEALERAMEAILKELDDADYILITHYHYDHYLYREEYREAYRGKVLLVKHPLIGINLSQKMRARRLLKKIGVEEVARKVMTADCRKVRLGAELELEFSCPVPHGVEGSELGYVVMVKVREGDDVFAYSSDVQGPMCKSALEILLAWRPRMLLLCGPPTYFEGYKISSECVELAKRNMIRLVEQGGIDTMVVDHHLLRDANYRERLAEVFSIAAKRNRTLMCAAEYMGYPVTQLEARRRRLWEGD